ncbi:hypothetical protein SeLEV6574_g06665 [Synchytrium endobioticum]|uniref:Uncharacterized protein n=1 Tax=Synchytrium endobioticum TaxID=286115 RepID=A0A507CGQ5_9FUNG|nr:hypothetical protein SeLEV6574_g06665 [Synchytrium endobioticum]
MAATKACSIKATAAMCLLWMVFLSASATGRSRKSLPAMAEAAFNNLGTYGDANELLVNQDKFDEFKWHVKHMNAKFQAIYVNLYGKLSQKFYPVDEEDLEDLKDLRKLVTTEKFPWPRFKKPIPGTWKAKYSRYFGLFEKCVTLYKQYMENTAVMIKKAIKKVEKSVYADNNLGDDPDMQTIRRIVLNEIEIWGGHPLSWETPAILSQSGELRHLRHRCNRGRLLINLHDEKHKHRSYSTPRLPQSPIDSATQGTSNHGDENIPDSSLGRPDDTTMRRYDPSEYDTSQNLQHDYHPLCFGGYRSTETTTPGPSSEYARTGTPYLPTPHDHTGLFSPYPGIDTPYPPTPHDPC